MSNVSRIVLYDGQVIIEKKEKPHGYWLIKDTKNPMGKKERLTGVTTYCGVKDKSTPLMYWAVNTTIEYVRQHQEALKESPDQILREAKASSFKERDLAADIGKAIHTWIEEFIKGVTAPEMPHDPVVLQGVVNFLKWVEERGVEFVESEQVVYSRKHGYVGTLDILAKINGKLYLIDIKTGKGIYSEMMMQTAAYVKAYEEQTGEEIEGRWIWRISKETEDEYVERMEAKGKEFAPYVPCEAVYLDDTEGQTEMDFDAFLACMTIHSWDKGASKYLRDYAKKG